MSCVSTSLGRAVARWLVAALALCLVASCGDRSEDLARRIAASPDEWISTGRTYDEQRYSPLAQINRRNVGNLSLAWYHDLDTHRGQEATPLMVGGVLYTTSAWSKVQAFDARTGRLLWQFDPEVPGEWGVRACCDVVNRGVAYSDGRVFVGTIDGRLVAIDAATGRAAWSVDTLVDRSHYYTITGAPRIVRGKVIIGNGGSEFGVRGYVSAYDVDDGSLAWRFFTVPGDPSRPFENPALARAARTWTGQWWRHGGGGTVWDSMAYDPELDLLYVGVGNGSPWNQAIRSPQGGDNLFLASIVALRPDTGEYVWHFQTTPGEQWDYTATQHMILADLDIGGRMRKVIMQAPKNGFFYVLDRETGAFISGRNYVPVNWARGLDPVTGRPDIAQEALYSRTGRPFLGTPGPMGGHSWHPMAFSPQTNLVYIPAQELSFPYVPDAEFQRRGHAVNLGIDLVAAGLPSDQSVRDTVRRSQGGRLIAWDPVRQREVWRVDHGGPWNGGVLATAGGLVFQGDRNQHFAAYDARTGARLWSADVQTGIVAAPISFELDGQQYIAVVAGWGGVVPLLLGELSHNEDGPVPNRSRVLVFRLNGRATLPPVRQRPRAQVNPPPLFGTAAQVETGRRLYARFCTGCHGDTAVSGGVLPDLRASAALANPGTWNAIVREGALRQAGMVSFADELSAEYAEAIRAYVTRRAHESRRARQSSAP